MTLIVCATEEEATFLKLRDEDDLVVTGPGKINATLGLVTTLLYLHEENRPHKTVWNLGVVTSLIDDLEEGVHEVGDIGQADFDAEGLKAKTGRTYGEDIILNTVLRIDSSCGVVSLATVDYPPDDARADLLAHAGFEVADMEGYAYAAVCIQLGVSFRSIKWVGGSSEATPQAWVARCNTGGAALAAWYEKESSDRYAKMIGKDLPIEERRVRSRALSEGAPTRRMRRR